MLRVLVIIISILLVEVAVAAEKVEYVADSISQKDGEYIQLLGGSSWILSFPSLVLVTDDVIIVFQTVVGKDKKKYVVPVFYYEGEEIIARYVKGRYIKESGYLVTVMQQYGEGAKLKLDDGSILTIPDYDRYDTGYWLPPYPALITSNA